MEVERCSCRWPIVPAKHLFKGTYLRSLACEECVKLDSKSTDSDEGIGKGAIGFADTQGERIHENMVSHTKGSDIVSTVQGICCCDFRSVKPLALYSSYTCSMRCTCQSPDHVGDFRNEGGVHDLSYVPFTIHNSQCSIDYRGESMDGAAFNLLGSES